MAEQAKHPIAIRPFRADDVDFVIDRQLALYKEEYGFDSDVWRAYLLDGVRELVRKFDAKKDCMYILECDGKRAGSMAVTHEDDETAKLRFFFVESDVRGLGAGRALFGKALEFCREKGYKRAFLWTFSTLYAARHIYESFDFQLAATQQNDDWGAPVTEERWELDFDAAQKNAPSPKETLRRWVETFNRADAAALAAFYDENAVNHQVANEPVAGRAAIKAMFEQEFAAAKMVCIVENIFEDGEWAIMEWKDPLGLRGCGFFHIVGGKIVFQRGYWDKLTFLKQHNLPVE